MIPAFQVKVKGVLGDGSATEISFDEVPKKDDIGALAVDPAAAEVFIQPNDARGRVVKLQPGKESLFEKKERKNIFLKKFFD